MLLEDIYKEFLFDLEIKNYSIRTIKGYRNNNRAFLTTLFVRILQVQLKLGQYITEELAE